MTSTSASFSPRFVLYECVELMFVLIVLVIVVFSLGNSARRTELDWFW